MRHGWMMILGIVAAHLSGASPVQAGPNQHAVLVLHVTPGTPDLECDMPRTDCAAARTAAPLGDGTAYLLLANASSSAGVAGIRFGLAYDSAPRAGVDLEAWFPCSDYAYPDPGWPAAGSGSTFLWDSLGGCPADGAPRVVAIFHLRAHTPDRLSIVAHPSHGQAEVVSCDGETDTLSGNLPSPLGGLDFGGGRGYNPCSRIVPINPSTWGSIESLFARS